MFRKPFALVIVVLMLAALPTVAFAKVAFFSADGDLGQTYIGDPVMVIPGVDGIAPLSYVGAVAPDAYGIVAPDFPSSDPLGVMTENQTFDGAIVSSDLSQLNGSDLSVVQNSWFDLTATDGGVIHGVAWGTFDLNKGWGNRLSGTYAARLDGIIVPDILAGTTCFNYATGEDHGGLYVAVTDIGDWTVADAHGSLEKVDPGDEQTFVNYFGTELDGNLSVVANGCLGGEQAQFSILGSYGKGHSSKDDDDHDNRFKDLFAKFFSSDGHDSSHGSSRGGNSSGWGRGRAW